MNTDDANDHPIDRFLLRVDKRLRMNEVFVLLPRLLWGFAGVLLVLKLSGLWDSSALRLATLAVYAIGAAVFVGVRVLDKRGLSRPAAAADTAADLKDSLRSAHAFLGLPERSDWMDLHISRTSTIAEELAPVEIVPMDVPRPVYYSAGVSALLLGLLLWNPSWMSALSEATLGRVLREAVTAESLSEDASVAESEPIDEAEPEVEGLPDIEESIEQLRRRDLELAERLRDLAEAQQALSATQLEMDRLEMDLENLGESLQSNLALADVAEALANRDPQEAAELLRDLTERLAEAQMSEELQALLESLQNADVQNADLAELMENLEQSGGEMSVEDMQRALEAAAAQLENMGQQMAQQAQDNQMGGEQMQSLQGAQGQQQAPSEQQMGQQQAGQAMQSATGMMSNQVQMAQMAGDPSSAVPVDAGPSGDTTGPGGGGDEQVLGEATSLEVQLEMELLEAPEREDPVPEEIFERLSREEKSKLNYEVVRERTRYAEEEALRRESVPWKYRALVKNYFLSILETAKAAESETQAELQTPEGQEKADPQK
jgi:hypothetical protein